MPELDRMESKTSKSAANPKVEGSLALSFARVDGGEKRGSLSHGLWANPEGPWDPGDNELRSPQHEGTSAGTSRPR